MREPTIFTRWNPATRRSERVPAGTPDAIEWMWCDWAGQYVTVPGRD
jgi:hypothetical protein